MRRRDVIAAAAGAMALPLSARAEKLVAPVTRASRRVRPGEAGWPGPAEWQKLKQAVGGNLIEVHPLFAVCDRDPKGAACQDVTRQIRNPFYIGDQPAGTQVSGWLDAWTSAASAYAVRARNATDVAAAVNFARAHNLRLVVKGGGHSYQGTSNAPDSLLVWTRDMNTVTLHDSFVPRGCEGRIASQPAVTAGAGAMWVDLYDAVTNKGGRYVQGGGCTSVGVAGLIQSGGFGSFSKGFGTAAASLLEVEIVTADGAVRIANACTNSDLFWALKGGGGGSWGVVTQLTLQTHDLPENLGGAAGKIQARSDDAFRKLIAQFVRFYAGALLNPHWGEQVALAPDNTLKISMVCQGLSRAEAKAVWQPFFDWVSAAPKDYAIVDTLRAGAGVARHWWDMTYNVSLVPDPRPGAPKNHGWWQGDQDQVGTFLHGYVRCGCLSLCCSPRSSSN